MKPKRSNFGNWLREEKLRLIERLKEPKLLSQEIMSLQGSQMTIEKAIQRWEESK